jgi:hypothetical protein
MLTNRLYVETRNALLDSISNLRIQSERSVKRDSAHLIPSE